MPADLRLEIDRLIADGDALRAAMMLRQVWLESPQLSTASFLVSRFEQLREKLEFSPCKLAFLRSFTLEPAIPLLRAQAFTNGIDLHIRLGDFNTYSQELLDDNSWLYSFSADVVILAVQTRDLAPALWNQFADLDAKAVDAAVEEVASQFEHVVRAFRAQSPAHLIIHSLEILTPTAYGLADARLALGQSAAIEKVNERLRQLTEQSKNIYILDLNALIARRGHDHWHDEKKWLTAAMPIAAGELIHLAREWLRFLHPITGRICKVLAVDLDNTLWGGVVGEDGIDGIKLDSRYPGAAYLALQRAILDVYRRGVLLAICSKNNPADATEVIEKHPAMLLRPEHFAAIRINWNDKAANLREIAKELNVGVDSIAFLDDNAVERAWIAEQIPEMTVIDLPNDPLKYAAALRDCPRFERLELTVEDKARGQMYVERRERSELKASAPSLEDFYRSLQMRVRVERLNDASLARAAQLTQKTNQFNLTTHRYSEEQLRHLCLNAEPRTLNPSLAFTIQVTDRFGDNGIVGLALLRMQDQLCEIDTFLLSCRVIGRTVETAFLATLAAEASKAGASRLAGWFISTKKNAPAAGFYEQHGFSKIREKDGATYWEIDLSHKTIAMPSWITMEGTGNER